MDIFKQKYYMKIYDIKMSMEKVLSKIIKVHIHLDFIRLVQIKLLFQS